MKQRASDLLDDPPRSPASDGSPPVETLNEEAWALHEAQPRRARDLAGRALELARRQARDLECAKALRTLGACELALGRHAQAREALEEALALLDAGQGGELRSWLERLLLRSHFQAQRYPEALRHGHRALELARELEDEREEARALNDLGFVYAHLSAFEEGLGYLLQSLELHERLGTPHLGSPLNNVGNIYLQQRKPAEARVFFARAAQAFAASGKRLETAIARGNLGRAAEALGELAAARAEHERSLALLYELEQPSYLAAGLTKLAGVLAGQGEPAAALERYQEALALQARHGCAFREETLLGLGALQLTTGEPASALLCYREVLELAEASGDARLMAEAHEGLSRAFEALGDAEHALEHYRRYHERVREHERALTSSRTTALLLQHELEQARREQALLREQHRALAEAHGQLRALHQKLSDKAAQLERLSLEDALTGLPNRRYLMRCLAAEAERAARLGQGFSLMLFDIDAFKRVNDDFSHAVGDLVLKAIAEITRRQMRRIDVPARLGGEEFVVVFPQTALEQAAPGAERLREAVEHHPWAQIHPGLRVTISAGVAAWAPRQTPEALLAAADAKLYAAKHGGKNRVVG